MKLDSAKTRLWILLEVEDLFSALGDIELREERERGREGEEKEVKKPLMGSDRATVIIGI